MPAADYGSPTSIHASTTGPETLTASFGGASALVTVPAGALPGGTTVSLYPIVTTAPLTGALPAGKTYLDSFAVTWATPDGATLKAVTPITMTITDPSIVTGDTIYVFTLSGVTDVGTAPSNGSVTVTFSSDPIYMLASSQTTQIPLSITTLAGYVGVGLKLATNGGSGTGTVSYTVTDGTALGCLVSAGVLTATRVGTCSVTATKAADPTYDSVSSTATMVAMSLLPRPAPVSVAFAKGRSSLTASAKRSLLTLSEKLIAGAQLTITSYAHGDAKLARSRADAVEGFVRKRLQLGVAIKIVTSTASNEVTVVTKRQ